MAVEFIKERMANGAPVLYLLIRDSRDVVRDIVDRYPKEIKQSVGGITFTMLVRSRREKGEVKGKYFERETISAVLDTLKSGGVLWDIGSSTGTYTLPAAIRCGRDGQVVAFEPDNETMEALKYNATLNNLSNISFQNVAISDNDGQARLEGSGLRAGAPRIVDSGFQGSSVEVHTLRIDSLVMSGKVKPPDTIKIDVEGHGLNVLRGLGSVRPKHIFMEIHPKRGENPAEIRKILIELGYTQTGDTLFRESEQHVHFIYGLN